MPEVEAWYSTDVLLTPRPSNSPLLALSVRLLALFNALDALLFAVFATPLISVTDVACNLIAFEFCSIAVVLEVTLFVSSARSF